MFQGSVLSDFVNRSLRLGIRVLLSSLLTSEKWTSHFTSLFNVLSKANNANSARMALLLVSQHLGDDLLMTLYLHSWYSSNLQNIVETARAVISDFTVLAQCPQCACSVTQPCLTLCYPMYHSPPCSSAHEISQARLLEWVAIFSSRGSSQLRDWTCISWISCIDRQIIHHWAT